MCFLLLCNLLFINTSSTCWFFLAQVLDPLQCLEWLELGACMIKFFWNRNGHRVVNVLPLNNSSKSASKRAPIFSSISILFWSFYWPGDRWCADGIDDLLRIRASELGIHYSEIPSIIRNRLWNNQSLALCTSYTGFLSSLALLLLCKDEDYLWQFVGAVTGIINTFLLVLLWW
jgi:hypothetical protein